LKQQICFAGRQAQSIAACHRRASRPSSRDGHQVARKDYGSSVRAAAEQASAARKEADRLACEAWNKRMLGLPGAAQPSTTVGDALNAGYSYLEMRCLGCDMHQTVALDIFRRPKATPMHELERYMRCRDCSRLQAIHISAATNEDLGE
jgi:ribosomal protein S27E